MTAIRVRLPVLVVALLLGEGCGERNCAEYPDVPTARVDGAFLRGWLPETIPGDAISIRECHDLGTGETRISFTLSRTAIEHLKTAPGVRVPTSAMTVPAFRDARWWPRELEGQLGPGKEAEFEIFELDLAEPHGRRLGFAVQPNTGRVYLWRTAA